MMRKRNDQQEVKGNLLIWESLRHDWPLWVWMAGLLIAGFLIYPQLPEQVPSHWNVRGEVDAYSSRVFGAFFAQGLSIGIYLLMLLIPSIDPKRENYSRFAGAYRFLRWGFVLFFSGMFIVTNMVALGYQLDVGLIVKAAVSVLMIIIGNVMGQLRHNDFVGIKTPWTLANEEVWQRTHRLGGKIWVLGGLLMLALSPVQARWGAVLFFILVVAMAIVPTVYSYIIYRRLVG
ncbi:MAG: SdpI family protein [Bacillota bacterium]